MKYVFLLLFAVAFGFGLYELMTALMGGSSSIGRRQIKKLEKWNRSESSIYKSFPFKQIIDAVSKYVKLEENNRKKLLLDLERAKLPYTPEEYTVSLYVGLAMCLIVALVFVLMNSLVLAALMALCGVYLWMSQRDHLKYQLKIKDKEIAKELPGFVLSMKSSLEGDRDILRCVERYTKIASEAFRPELEIFLLEARSGNFDLAVQHLANRLNSQHASTLASILVQVNRGVDQSSAMEYLAHEMQNLQNQLIDAELASRPSRMQKAVIPVFVAGVVLMFVSMFISVMDSFENLFG